MTPLRELFHLTFMHDLWLRVQANIYELRRFEPWGPWELRLLKFFKINNNKIKK